ncbi:hypothetical protein [Pseudomonas sp. p1(2021b)]|uniref:hypothetical protein n=1 Tax=Pseudomonas sp. p1(2021b) TaxID=2874628 RepID=UPI003D2D9A68
MVIKRMLVAFSLFILTLQGCDAQKEIAKEVVTDMAPGGVGAGVRYIHPSGIELPIHYFGEPYLFWLSRARSVDSAAASDVHDWMVKREYNLLYRSHGGTLQQAEDAVYAMDKLSEKDWDTLVTIEDPNDPKAPEWIRRVAVWECAHQNTWQDRPEHPSSLKCP